MDKYICPCGYEYDPAAGDPDNGVALTFFWWKREQTTPWLRMRARRG